MSLAKTFVHSLTLTASVLAMTWALTGIGAQAAEPVFRVVMVEDLDGDPTAAGRDAGKQLLTAMGDAPLKAVFVSECFEDRQYKEELMAGLTEVLPADKIFGGATYGSFTQKGCTDFDAVGLLGIGGAIDVQTGLVTEMGTSKLVFDENEPLIRERLHAAGRKLAEELTKKDDSRLMMVFADAHSPKVQYLVEGVQKVTGDDFPITGGCANKNAGQTFVYYKGRFHEDAALALMLSGDFGVSLSGRQAMEEQVVIDSAFDGAAEVMKGKPESKTAALILAFNCAGRRSKLDDYDEELASMQKATGKSLPLFGCYCAGEIGPVQEDVRREGALCGGSGWHVMFTLLWK